ncbi:response regulator [Saccharibacillus sp. CPCC 101409]|uniref:response regulator transcription factor n=1 Tax=Saccharibacillus sp. CPCC 101409 TaxID=3058041 RepID=UPI0026733691|nr:response regulator [Saccharibacillus sp. CPCC 101409]MDO3412318.1 response regulator [Saccharibacillus sp. CPCC 101409]
MYNVLLVDDEPLAIEGLKLMVEWEKYGFRIGGTCENGQEAIRRIRSDSPDLVVTDIRMPVMDGLQLIEEARRTADPSPMFVVTSGYDDFDYALRAMRLGVSNYLTKPVMDDEAEDMLRSLSEELERRRTSRAIGRERQAEKERRALAAALFGGEEERRRALPELERLSEAAQSWIYIHVKAEAGRMPDVRNAALAAEETGCRRYLLEAGDLTPGVVIGAADGRASEEARRFAQELASSLPPESQRCVRLAVGRSAAKPGELRESFESAQEAAGFLFFDSGQTVVFADTADRPLSCDPSALLLADRIAAMTETGSEEEISAEIAEVFERFEAERLLPELIQTFAARVAVRCARICGELGGEPEQTIRSLPSFEHFSGFRDLRETKSRLEKFCLDFRREAARLRERSSGGVQAKVADFLRNRYTETFAIRELAEMFYVNPVYLGQSFARKYGVGISEFVHELRIEEACRLLRESDRSSCAIAEKLGYKAYRHFLKQFEKKTGKKPAEYRAQAFG